MKKLDTEMDDKSGGRRNLLKKVGVSSGALAAGSVLPKTWVKPVLASVALPAHAQTSEPGGSPVGGTTAAPVGGTTAAPPTTTLPPCILTSVTAIENASGSFVHTTSLSGLNTSSQVTDVMGGPEFSQFQAFTQDCPDGTEITLVIDIPTGMMLGSSIAANVMATVTAGVATFPATGPLNFDAMMSQAGLATFTITGDVSQTLDIAINWAAAP